MLRKMIVVTFQWEKITEHLTRIHGITGELMYLAEGTQKAALVDTGSGIGSLRALVETLTDKPCIVLLTHGHVDHAMGAPEFDTEIYMNPADNAVHDEHSNLEFRKGSLQNVPEEIVSKIEESDYIPLRTKEYLPLMHGDTFDLGGLTLEAYACPGHTPGSMVILFKEERSLLLGDACNPFTFLFSDHCLYVEEYKESLKTLKEQTDGKYDRVYLSHGPGDGEANMIEGVIQVCDDIMSGNTDDMPFDFMGEKAFLAKTLTPKGRADGGVGNIVYKKDRVWKTKG